MAGRISYYGGIVTNGLVLDLDAAKRDSYPGTGITWRDISGQGYTGTLTNGPTFDSTNGGNIVFDGVDDYTLVSNIPFGTNPFTINIWFKMNGNQSTNNSLISVNAAAAANNYQLSFLNNTSLRFYYKGPLGTDAFDIVYTFSSNVWYNVCITKNTNNDITSYVNAASNTSVNYATNYNFTENIRLGVNRSTSSYYKGSISSVHLYSNKGFSAAEVLQNYNAIKGRFGL